MHYHLEIVMPPTDNVKLAVEQTLKPFIESAENKRTVFMDSYVIGGRYAAMKLLAPLSDEKIAEFYQVLKARKITVSSVVAGREALKQESQIPLVDKLWKEFFPDFPGDVCPLFNHYSDQYEDSLLCGNVTALRDVPTELTAYRVIIAKQNREDTFCAEFMVSKFIWNGVCYNDINWDGKLSTALAMALNRRKVYIEEYVKKHTPNPDWLAVTVDYHE